MGRRGNGEGSIYRTADGRWRGSITVGRDADGRLQRRYIQRKTRAAVVAELRKLANQRDTGGLAAGPDKTVGAWLEYYLTEIAPRKRRPTRRSTLATYRGYMRTWVIPRIGHVKLRSLTPEHLEGVYRAMEEAGRAPATILQVHRILHVAIGAAHKRGDVPRNVADVAETPVGRRSDVRALTVEEARRIIAAAERFPRPARWHLALGLGLRRGEALGIRWADVDLDAGTLRLRQQLQRDRTEHGCGMPVGTRNRPQRRTLPDGTVETTEVEVPVYPCGRAQAARCPQADGGGLQLVPFKTAASRAVLPLPPQIVQLLRARRAEQLRERLQEGTRWVGWEWDGEQADLVFTQRNGRPISPEDDWSEWYELLKAAQVEPIRPHAARHSAATLLVALGVHPRVAMALLRHTNIATTMNTYADAPDDLVREAVEAMASTLADPGAQQR